MTIFHMIDGALLETWATHEHYDISGRCIFVGVSRLDRLGEMKEVRSNHEWVRRSEGATIRIVVTGLYSDQMKAKQHMFDRMFDLQPVCNYSKAKLRCVVCSNGETYSSQTDAAAKLGITQSEISKVITGRLKQTHGLTFRYQT